MRITTVLKPQITKNRYCPTHLPTKHLRIFECHYTIETPCSDYLKTFATCSFRRHVPYAAENCQKVQVRYATAVAWLRR